MNRYIKPAAIGLFCASLLFGGCNESYPGIIYVEEDDVTSNFESSDSIPIMLTVRPPQLHFVTRGSGAIDTTNSEWKKRNTLFYVYAFQAKNSIYDGEIDFRKRAVDKADDCIVDGSLDANGTLHGKKAVFGTTGNSADTDGSITWADRSTVYYNYTHQDYKYNFFIYHLDDAIIDGDVIHREKERIYMDVKFDGTQDIISGMARSAGESTVIERLEAGGMQELVADYRGPQNYVYSTILGHRGIHPNFQIQHELVRFKFLIEKGDSMARDIQIKDIILTAQNKARLVVASQDVSEIGLDYSMFQGEKGQFHLPEKIVAEDGTVSFTPTNQSGLNPEKYRMDSIYVNGKLEYFNPKSHTIEVGSELLLMPQTAYDLTLVCEQKVYKNGQEGVQGMRPTYKLCLDETLTRRLEAGKIYTIKITVYGLQEISLNINGVQWTPGEDIPLDEEDLFN